MAEPIQIINGFVLFFNVSLFIFLSIQAYAYLHLRMHPGIRKRRPFLVILSVILMSGFSWVVIVVVYFSGDPCCTDPFTHWRSVSVFFASATKGVATHVIAYRVYLIWYSLRLSASLADNAWRVKVTDDVSGKGSFFIRHASTLGKPKWAGIYFTCWFFFTFLGALFTVIVSGGEFTSGSRLMMFLAIFIPFSHVSILSTCAMPRYVDAWHLKTEVRAMSVLYVLSQFFVMFILQITGWEGGSNGYAIVVGFCSTSMSGIALSIQMIWVFKKLKLPIWPWSPAYIAEVRKIRQRGGSTPTHPQSMKKITSLKTGSFRSPVVSVESTGSTGHGGRGKAAGVSWNPMNPFKRMKSKSSSTTDVSRLRAGSTTTTRTDSVTVSASGSGSGTIMAGISSLASKRRARSGSKSMSKRNKYKRINSILADSDGLSLFAQHCNREFSLESICFLIESEQFVECVERQMSEVPHRSWRIQFASNVPRSAIVANSDTNLFEKCIALFDKYLSGRGEFDLNVSFAVKKEVCGQVGFVNGYFIKNNDSPNGRPERDVSLQKGAEWMEEAWTLSSGENVMNRMRKIFTPSRREIYRLINDTFSRFNQTPVYTEWAKNVTDGPV